MIESFFYIKDSVVKARSVEAAAAASACIFKVAASIMSSSSGLNVSGSSASICVIRCTLVPDFLH